MSMLDKLRVFGHGEVAGGKVALFLTLSLQSSHFMNQFVRAQRSISEPPTAMSNVALVSQASNDVFTAEKLQSVEVYRQGGRAG
jgi:hypothetical protein